MKTTFSCVRNLLLLLFALIFTACPKKHIDSPEPDLEFQSSLDVVWATSAITDIEQVCAFGGEENLFPDFYVDRPGSFNSAAGTGSYVAYRNTAEGSVNFAFNHTQCVDEKERSGTVWMRYFWDPAYGPAVNPHSEHPHQYGFCGRISLVDYRVDGWLIETPDDHPAVLRSIVQSASFDPRVLKLSWSMSGRFIFTHPTDPMRNIVWEGELVKTLMNSTDREVWEADATHARDRNIDWKKGIVSYTGHAGGMVLGNVSYELSFGDQPADPARKAKPIIRDFSCSPDVVSGTSISSNGQLRAYGSGYHPFVRGIMSFRPGESYPREIFFGDEVVLTGNDGGQPNDWDAERMVSAGERAPCDNSGIIRIKGRSNVVDFRR